MPTTRPRHFITESDELAAALDEAAQRWPGLRRSQRLVRLALEGHRAAAEEQKQRAGHAARRYEDSGRLTGTYGPSYLEDLRSEWPE